MLTMMFTALLNHLIQCRFPHHIFSPRCQLYCQRLVSIPQDLKHHSILNKCEVSHKRLSIICCGFLILLVSHISPYLILRTFTLIHYRKLYWKHEYFNVMVLRRGLFTNLLEQLSKSSFTSVTLYQHSMSIPISSEVVGSPHRLDPPPSKKNCYPVLQEMLERLLGLPLLLCPLLTLPLLLPLWNCDTLLSVWLLI